MNDKTLNSIYMPLKITFGAIPFLAGLDKFFNILTDWKAYLSPNIAALLPVSPEVFMGFVGVIEMIVGLAVLTWFTRLGAYVACAWLVLIAGNLILGGVFDVAVRDLALAVSAFTLGQLAALRGEALIPQLSSHRTQLPFTVPG